ncbi:glycosyltransferase family 4 protein [Oleiagrimonas sp. C23AA]|nr:glycosyltransferase family 4 protein [Oleiagrimonas sp. C23AA]
MHSPPAVWFPTVRTGTGTDVFTETLVAGLRERGIRAEITWLPLRAEYAPWSVPVPEPPAWANVAHVNTWLHTRFLPHSLPVVATIHHSVHHPDLRTYKGTARAAYHRFWIAPNERRVMRLASKVCAVSKFVAQTAKETLSDLPMDVIYNGVDTDRYRPCASRPSHKPFRLLYVGSWRALKGVDMLAPIMRELGDDFELLYTGGSDARKDKLDMPENMQDIGRLDGSDPVIAAMQDADAFVFPSRSEGFGLVAAEAMACGLPVIAGRGGALAELIEDGVTGMLCTPNDTAGFIEAVRCLASDCQVLRRMSHMAVERTRGHFSITYMVNAYVELYSRSFLAEPSS